MPTSVTMPALGESVTEGTVTRWLKQEGEHVEADEPLLEVSTDKGDTEIPSPASGTLTKIRVAADETVEFGSELAVIGGDGDASGAAAGAPPEAPAEPASAEDQEMPAAPAEQVQESAPEPEPAPASGGGGDGGQGGGAADGTPVTMPALGESVTEGTVTRWLKAVGDEVTADEPLLEVSTDKGDTEIPAPASGTLLEITVGEDETVEVGAQLAVIGTSSESAAPAAAPQQEAAPAQQEERPQ